MKTRNDYISIIQSQEKEIKGRYEVESLRLFGSVARNEHTEKSDVDICVNMAPKIFLLSGLKAFLQNLLKCSVDIVRMHKHINPYLAEQIRKDGVVVF